MFVHGEFVDIRKYDAPLPDAVGLADTFGIRAFADYNEPVEPGQPTEGYRVFLENEDGVLMSPTGHNPTPAFFGTGNDVEDGFYYWRRQDVAETYSAYLALQFLKQRQLPDKGRYVLHKVRGIEAGKFAEVERNGVVDEGNRMHDMFIDEEELMSISVAELKALIRK